MTLMYTQGHPSMKRNSSVPLVAPAAVSVDAFPRTLYELLSLPKLLFHVLSDKLRWSSTSQIMLWLRSTWPSLTNHLPIFGAETERS